MTDSISSIFGGSNDDALQAQREANAEARKFIERQYARARSDAVKLFPQGQQARGAGTKAALGVTQKQLAEQLEAFQRGNVSAQNQYQSGQVDYRRAILGLPERGQNARYENEAQPLPSSNFVNPQLNPLLAGTKNLPIQPTLGGGRGNDTAPGGGGGGGGGGQQSLNMQAAPAPQYDQMLGGQAPAPAPMQMPPPPVPTASAPVPATRARPGGMPRRPSGGGRRLSGRAQIK